MPQFATNTQLPRYLWNEQERIEKIARSHGLDFLPDRVRDADATTR